MPENIVELLRRHAAERSGRTAFAAGARLITFAGLEESTRRDPRLDGPRIRVAGGEAFVPRLVRASIPADGSAPGLGGGSVLITGGPARSAGRLPGSW